MGQNDRVELVDVLGHVREIGEHDVDAEHVIAREGEAGVEQHHAAAVLEHRHVLANLTQPTQRGDPHRVSGHQAVAAGSKPELSSPRVTAAASEGVASTSGSLRPPTPWPSRLSANLSGMGLVVTASAS